MTSVGMKIIDSSISVVTTVEYSDRFRIRVIDEIEPFYTTRGVSVWQRARQLDAHVLLPEDLNVLDAVVSP